MLTYMDAMAWYGKQTEFETAGFGALALIEPLIQKIDLVKIINQHLQLMGRLNLIMVRYLAC